MVAQAKNKMEYLSLDALNAELDRLLINIQVGELAGADVAELKQRLEAVETAIQRSKALAARAQGDNSVMLLEIAMQYRKMQPRSGRAVLLEVDAEA